MTVVTRSVLWSKEVPRGWKVVTMRQGSTMSSYYLSPEGKRFASLETAKEHIASQLADLSDTEGNEFIHSPRRKKRKHSGEQVPGAKRLKFDNDVEEDDVEQEPISLPLEIQRRRKLMAARSPFRNLLKRTLVRNHVRAHGRGTWKTTTPVQKPKTVPAPSISPVPSLSPVPSISPALSTKRVKCYDPPAPLSPPVTPPVAKVLSQFSLQLPETPPKAKPDVEMTPPRNTRRESMLFTPPNLTPPVTRRHSAMTFTSPNQRPLKSRSRILSKSQPNFNV
eukprot:GFUD01023525.1.p1 GENE.GFUD01023525.1~~GFUD01023525.1.p1  ORF type:complete len:279 (+),score=62.28 GFUD01023525.1:303-1139(+)